MKRFFFVLSFLCFILSVNYCLAIPADVEDISGRNYFPAVHNILQNAQKNIYVVMYYISFNVNRVDNVTILVNDLVDANKRGIKVKIILDRNVEYGNGEDYEIKEKNKKAFEYLKLNGVEVYFDNDNTLTHAKAIVVDDNLVIVGSTNWSFNSLSANNEAAVIIRSSELAKSFTNYFDTIAIDHIESDKEAISYIKLSKDVLYGPLAYFVKTDNKGCWNLMMWLLGNHKSGELIDFDYDIVDLDIDVGGDKDRFRARLNENLKILQNKYDLVEANIAYGKNAQVTIKPWVNEKESGFEIPVTLWKYEWGRKLSLPAQLCLFINFMNSGTGHEKWFKSKELLEKEFGISHSTISDGMLELKRWNLIDIEWGNLDKGFADRPANRYVLKNLYSMGEFNNELEKLKMKYSTDKIEKVRGLAKIILEENNLEHIEDIVLLIEQYGENKVQAAFDKVSKYKIDNPMRTMRYVAGIVKSDEIK
jgi:HKD family nuclease